MKRFAVSALLLLCWGCNPVGDTRTSESSPPAESSEYSRQIPEVHSLRDTVRVLSEEIGERNFARPNPLNTTRSYLAQRLEKLGYQVEQQSFQGERFQGEAHNLIATIPGNSEILVIGAHYDSALGTPGANDNGSGVAVLLQLAERLKEGEFQRTIRFVLFANEEPPYFMSQDMGSLVYANSCAERGDQIVGMLSLETMGFYSKEKGSQRFPEGITGYPDTGDFLAFVSEPNSESLLQECLDHFEGLPVESLVAPHFVEGVSWSDHSSFWRNGYPAVMITDTAPFRYPHYHRTTDTVEQLDYERLGLAADGLEQVVRFLARETDLPGPSE